MYDVVIFSSDSFMPRTNVCIASVKEHIPNSNIHLVKVENPTGNYVEGLAKDRLKKAKDLLENGSKEVIILGADCVFYNDPSVFLNISGHVVLTPHVIKPPVNNGAQLYGTGHCNADMILFRKWSLPLLEWLINQEMKNDVAKGIFYEQTWLSALPFVGEYVGICRDPGINYAYFNFSERTLTNKNNTYYVNGNKLAMLQYSGFVPGKISKHYNGPVDDLTLELFKDYEKRVS